MTCWYQRDSYQFVLEYEQIYFQFYMEMNCSEKNL
jgi:hypothetical protein